ncbi:MAG: LPS biosynthesis protein WbpP [Candidatus Rokuibacteriota bacterium]|nr:MAG: LPS biosynthesis protein WbpP [Candidatus Rokubacteria bacterium]
MSTVLVTGGAGFMGSHLVERLLEEGIAVRILDNLSTGSLGNLQGVVERFHGQGEGSGGVKPGGQLEVVIGDVRDRELVRTATRNVQAVFHLAAIPSTLLGLMSPAELETVNVQGTLNVLQAAVTEGVRRLVFASSASVYGTPESLPVSETCPLKPESLFAASKLAAEMYCRTYATIHKLDVVTLRYFSVYGPRQGTATGDALIPELIEVVRRRPTVFSRGGTSAEDLTYVDDAVEATRAAAAAPNAGGQTINIGSGRMSSVLEILHILYDLLKVPPVAASKLTAPISSSCVQAGVALAADLLGCTARVSLAMGLARVVRAMTDPEAFDGQALVGSQAG